MDLWFNFSQKTDLYTLEKGNHPPEMGRSAGRRAELREGLAASRSSFSPPRLTIPATSR
jgi:hypothetical protein